ncbi:restriction endonuclease subunit S [Xanthomonas arboricola pv. juglandis]|uniref:restriction endonuclease subunit S n=1 Tax=Xanthomonas arboricola TaxID=56448 RepID=UPI00063ECF4D|nr:restriction endonuclease subunit S [Xanthomonas arboricola]ELP1400334.1 restriction endonuclease subunit S [Pseudomonas aeruginosa]MBN5032381.1 restriction endonuclease subunit S [Stenotrophomonas maltophilia]MDN0221629.1 restriction endonuclease subunit S [Xanthomonas arboricola pv. juglandis]MDN0225987.1 restriction endonuclease subunit S [Xanthomonas arboricola pv. juglandis]MDN0230144.1 restriction endonuclease subunit S [Xanthomonas arboricola pv. juglandis]
MSSVKFLEKLLDGAEVKWRALGTLGELVRGNGLQKKDFTEAGVPAIHYGQIYTYYGLSTTETKSFVSPELARQLKKVNKGDVVITNTSENLEDVGKALVYLGEQQAVTGGHASILKPGRLLLGKYFAYFTQTNQFASEKRRYAKGAKVIDISATDMAKISIPIPCPEDSEKSLEIQTEIVRILDAFTELTAELTAELTVRKRQYNYYRDQLLKFEEGDVEWKTLGDLAENLDSMRKPITSGLRESGDIPYYGASGIVDYVKDYIFDCDLLLVSEDGANLLARNTPIAFSISGKSWVNNHAHVLKFETYAERRYVEYYLNSIDLTPYISGAAQPKLNKKNLESISIPDRSPEEKKRIVAFLDKFDALTNSITDGLPREIALRQKQYEYYRDQLLSFSKPVAVEA